MRFTLLFAVGLVSSMLACGGAADGDAPDPTPPPPRQPAPPASTEEPTAPTACGGGVYVADVARWRRSGSNPDAYEMTVDRSRSYCDKPGAHVRSLSPTAGSEAFGTFMDIVPAEGYRQKRIRLRGIVETADVTGWSGLWLRVDSGTKKVLAFDNMGKRPLRGTLAPSEHAIVLDVPEGAAELAFGVLLAGGGEVWTKQVVIEVVGTDVPTTGS